MKIEILCGGGSPDGVHLSDINGENGRVGVGGSELALLTMCEGWSKDGNEVVLYNNPKRQDGFFEQRNVADFERCTRGDVVIFFREPTTKALYSGGAKKVFWSCDQYTVGDFAHFSKMVDKIVTISPFHTRYFQSTYNIQNSIAIDIPIRTWEYEFDIETVPNRLIFTSVPDRGLEYVAKTFPAIRQQVPNASLVITSDYRLWGVANPMNNQYIQMFLRMEGVEFLGAVTRNRLIEEQMRAQVHYYPCCYDELFCIAVAESEVAGVLPITTPTGALESTNMGIIIDGNPASPAIQQAFVQTTVEALSNPDLHNIQSKLQDKARKRFNLKNIMQQWSEKIFND